MTSEAPIAIVGMGGVFPGASDLTSFYQLIYQGINVVSEPPPGRWQLLTGISPTRTPVIPDGIVSNRACFVDSFSVHTLADELGLDRSWLESLDPLFHFALAAGYQAFQDGKTANLNRQRAGVILGNIELPTDMASALAREYIGRTIEEKVLRRYNSKFHSGINPLNRYVSGLPGGVLAKSLGFGLGSFTLDAACASSLYAIKLAADELLSGRADAMLAGGISRPDSLYTQVGFSQLLALSPTGICAPFSVHADGLVVGEGAAIFLLKRLDDALTQGDRIYALIRGIGLANDVEGKLLAPSTEGQLRAMRTAYRMAGWQPQDVDLIECHGTGTPVGDKVELTSLRALWGKEGWKSGQCAIGSVKSNIGHLLTAAGGASLTKILMAFQEETILPTANIITPLPELKSIPGPFRLPVQPEPWVNPGRTRRAAISAFGFGGINAHLLLEEWPSASRKSSAHGAVQSNPIRIKPTPKQHDVAIVGMDAHFGPWCSLDDFRRRVLGEDTITEPKTMRHWFGVEQSEWFKRLTHGREDFKGFTIDSLEVATDQFRLPPREIEAMLPQQIIMLQVAAGALADAGQKEASHLSSGLFIGLNLDFNTTNFQLRWWLRQQAAGWAKDLGLNFTSGQLEEWTQALCDAIGPPLTAERTTGSLGGIVASRIAREFKIGGPSFTLACEENSGTRALQVATQMIREGSIDTAIVGAVDLAADIRSVLSMHAGRPFSAENKVRPFTAKADGTVVGEGAAAVVLKRLDDAVSNQHKIYAVIKGIGTAGGGACDQLIPHPTACSRAIEQAHSDGNTTPDLVGYLETHGSGIPAEDWMEAEALVTSYSIPKANGSYAIGSVKADIGHTGAAAGMASLIKACLCLHHRVIPPFSNNSVNWIRLPPTFYAPQKAIEWLSDRNNSLRHAAVNCFSLDGNCTHIVLAEHDALGKARHSVPLAGQHHSQPTRTFPTIHIPIGKGPIAIRGIQGGTTKPLSALPFPEIQLQPSAVVLPEQRSIPANDSPGQHYSLETLLRKTAATIETQATAHDSYLKVTASIARSLQSTVLFFQDLLKGFPINPATVEQTVQSASVTSRPKPYWDRTKCLEFAVGSAAKVLGSKFEGIDTFPTRVRLPAEPLMLVDRIVNVEGEPGSLAGGRVVTEHDILHDAWYLDNRHIPTCIAVEAGQADLFLSAYLGIDFATRGLSCYRLLDAVVTFHRDLPGPGSCLRYEIEIEQFFRQGETHFFRFSFEASVNGEPLLSMKEGMAGFFSNRALVNGQGLVRTRLDQRSLSGKKPDDWQALAAMTIESYDQSALTKLRAGDYQGCFGVCFADLHFQDPLTIPGGKLRLIDRVLLLEPGGGRFGMGLIRGEADIHPDDWFLTCHFVDDHVMPGTLMYECCLHTLRVFLLRLGWVGEQAGVQVEPVPGISSRLKCRGQVIQTTKTVMYEVTIKEIGYRPEPYALADSLIFADGKPIVEITDLSLCFSGLSREKIEETWKRNRTKTLYDNDKILAFAIGNPSDAFGEPYRIFNSKRIIARLPGPPYQFINRITKIAAEPWQLKAGGIVEAEFDVIPNDWYFKHCGVPSHPEMPFAVLLEIGLQPCGWLAAYVGSALTCEEDLCFRNLGGTGTHYRAVFPDAGTLTTTVHLTRVSKSAGMIIQHYDFRIKQAERIIYQGHTYFGFFTRLTLAQQVGIREFSIHPPQANDQEHDVSYDYPSGEPFPGPPLRMVERITMFDPDGGLEGLGMIQGEKKVDPAEWFFKAHFYQDPVCPGSLGLESFLQLVKVMAIQRWGTGAPQPAGWNSASYDKSVLSLQFTTAESQEHRWLYRGQIVPANRIIVIQAVVKAVDDQNHSMTADGLLQVDGKVIYQMTGFTLKARSSNGKHD